MTIRELISEMNRRIRDQRPHGDKTSSQSMAYQFEFFSVRDFVAIRDINIAAEWSDTGSRWGEAKWG